MSQSFVFTQNAKQNTKKYEGVRRTLMLLLTKEIL